MEESATIGGESALGPRRLVGDEEENDLDMSAGKLVIDLDFQSGEENASGGNENKINSNLGGVAGGTPENHSATSSPSKSIAPSSNGLRIPANYSAPNCSPSAANSAKRKASVKRSANSKDASNDKLKLKIKRKRMPTRTSAASHEIISENGTDVVKTEDAEKTTNGPSPPAKKPKSSIAQEHVEQRDATTWVRTISTGVDGDSLGPCEPGTHVSLDGIVWNETPAGVLVVNVTWRGKSYVGTLLDCTKYDWAPPRLCESPVDPESAKGSGIKGRNGKRPLTRPLGSVSDLKRQTSVSANAGKTAAKKGSQDSAEEDGGNLSGKDGDGAESSSKPPKVGETILEPMSPIMKECPCTACDKQFDQGLAMKFHQNSSHRNMEERREQPPLHVATDLGAPMDQAGAENPETDPAAGDATKLSDVETESLKKLFQVVVSPNSAAATTNAATTAAGTTTTTTTMSVPPLGANLSATKVKAVATVAPRTANSDLPKLEPSEERAGSTSPAYSDISDDGAPVLEKEVDKLNCAAGANESTSSVKAPEGKSGGEPGRTEKSPSGKQKSSPSNNPVAIASEKATEAVPPAARIEQTKTEAVAPVTETKEIALRGSNSVSPATGQPAHARPHVLETTSVVHSSNSVGPAAAMNPALIPSSAHIGIPFGQMPRMFPFDPSQHQLITAGFLAPAHPGFGFAVNSIAPVILPTQTTMASVSRCSQLPVSSAQHKITELVGIGGPNGSPQSRARGSMDTGQSKQRVSSGAGCSPAVMASSSATPPTSINDFLKMTQSSLKTSSASPPVQRHMHTHHHTHNFPFIPAPPFTLISSQQSPVGPMHNGYQQK